MKYTIEGFSQEELLRLRLDAVDAHLLRWFVDFQHTSSMDSVTHNKKQYYWVSYQALSADMPILGLDARAVAARFARFVKCGLMARQTKHFQSAKRSYFRLIPAVFTALVSKPTHPAYFHMSMENDMWNKKTERRKPQKHNTLQATCQQEMTCEKPRNDFHMSMENDMYIKDDPSTIDPSTTHTAAAEKIAPAQNEKRGCGASLSHKNPKAENPHSDNTSLSGAETPNVGNPSLTQRESTQEQQFSVELLAEATKLAPSTLYDLMRKRHATLNGLYQAFLYVRDNKKDVASRDTTGEAYLRLSKIKLFTDSGDFARANGTKHLNIPALQAQFYQLSDDEQCQRLQRQLSKPAREKLQGLPRGERWLDAQFLHAVSAALSEA